MNKFPVSKGLDRIVFQYILIHRASSIHRISKKNLTFSSAFVKGHKFIFNLRKKI